jgi:REP element-mobilizing transposase RayT
MPYDPELHHRHSLRLQEYDYSRAGFYFITICTQNRECLFGDIEDGYMRLNAQGRIVCEAWYDLPNHYDHVKLDKFVIMPNHFHGVVILNRDATVGAGFKPAPTTRHAVPEIIRGFKTFSSRRINEMRESPGTKVWQRNYHEHIIRTEESYIEISEYIQTNPLKWHLDKYYAE